MIDKNLELRMYFFVPYNISKIQQGIQAGHASMEYSREYGSFTEYIDFADNHKTWIILNGGTTNSKLKENANPRIDDEPYIGSLDNIYNSLLKNNVRCTCFFEPDLNDALTAVCFIADERVFNYDDYPDIKEFLGIKRQDNLWNWTLDEFKEKWPDEYYRWVESLGGEKNLFLRDLLKNKKLA